MSKPGNGGLVRNIVITIVAVLVVVVVASCVDSCNRNNLNCPGGIGGPGTGSTR